MDNRQVTVFGGSGFVGRYVVRALAARGLRVRVAVRHPQLADFTRTAGDVGQVMAVLANLRFPQSVAAAIAGSGIVVNAAGISYQRGRQRYRAVHADGARHIAEAAAKAGVSRLIHISGIGAQQPRSGNAFVESKAEAEHEMNRAFPGVTILRPSVVFGPEDKFFNRLAAAAQLAPIMPIFGDGMAKFQPVFAGDVAAAVAQAVADVHTAFGVYELGGPRVYTYRELVELTLRMTSRHRRLLSVPVLPVKIAAFFAEFLPVPPITRDQVDLMTRDNIVTPGRPGFAELGIVPRAAEAILPTYLDRFRASGRYDLAAPA
ncbi:MAG: complex I NDUFA9 subunit family protein [Alphaproteobacteria bacterium]|nr:complex I NDUFA9 subunit family protein [Alphaproteobacteria bacterium]